MAGDEVQRLLERVTAAEHGCYNLDRDIALALNVPFQPFSQKVDAALALVERVLPGCWWGLGDISNRRGIDPEVMIRAELGHPDLPDWPKVFGKTAPLAILAALLTALQQDAETTQAGEGR